MWHVQSLQGTEREPRVDAVSRTLSSGVWLGLALLVLPLFAFVGSELVQTLNRTARVARDSDQIGHIVAIITTMRDFEHTLEEAEHAERSYFLTGQHAYLQTYREAVADAPDILAKLQRLTSADPQ
jgi:CHASE3 domain sensor protein